MKRREVSSAVGVCMGLILLLQCGHVCAQTAEQIPKPEYYGAYVVDGNNLLRVDVSWSTFSLQKAKIAVIAGVWPARSVTNADVVQLGPNMKFLFYGESPADGAALSTVRPLFFKRNTTTWNGNQRPPQLEKTESANYWEARDEEIKLLIKPIERQPQMVLAVTAKPLADGVYVFNSGHDTLYFSRGSIEAARRAMCFDEANTYVIALWNSKLTPCSESEPAPGTSPTVGTGTSGQAGVQQDPAVWDKALSAGRATGLHHVSRNEFR